ncbi:hypothetical protein J3F83DRAFT_724200 [Trichoderma novae-zelandiae]
MILLPVLPRPHFSIPTYRFAAAMTLPLRNVPEIRACSFPIISASCRLRPPEQHIQGQAPLGAFRSLYSSLFFVVPSFPLSRLTRTTYCLTSYMRSIRTPPPLSSRLFASGVLKGTKAKGGKRMPACRWLAPARCWYLLTCTELVVLGNLYQGSASPDHPQSGGMPRRPKVRPLLWKLGWGGEPACLASNGQSTDIRVQVTAAEHLWFAEKGTKRHNSVARM